jgi:Cation/multidrug efflux pump
MESKPSFDQLYLDRLKFKPELKKMWLSFFVYRFRVIVLMIALITAWGIYSFAKLPRESNPEVKIPIAVVSTVFPGAAPADIEELVTKKIETKIAGISGIDTVTSQSSNSISSVVVQFDADLDVDDSIRKVRDALGNVKNELPEDAGDPAVSEVSLDDTPILSVALSGDYNGFTLYDYAKDIKDELEKIPGVREVSIAGGDRREIEINYSPEKLNHYGITLPQANNAVAAANIAIPSGNFEGSVYVYPVRTDGRIYDARQLQELPVGTAGGTPVFLKDVASVKETAIEKTKISRIASNGQSPSDAVTLNIVKRTGGNIIDTVARAKNVLNGFTGKFPD